MALFYIALLVPAVLGFLSIKTKKFAYTAAVSYSGIALILLLFAAKGVALSYAWWILLALAVSIGGDYLLSRNRGLPLYIAGIAAFSVAHLLLFVYCLNTLAIPVFGWIMAVLFTGALLYYTFTRVVPKRESWYMVIPYTLYAVLSGLTLGLSFGVGGGFGFHIFFIVGILLLVVSDLCITEDKYASNLKAAKWIMPLYFASRIALTAAVIALAL